VQLIVAPRTARRPLARRDDRISGIFEEEHDQRGCIAGRMQMDCTRAASSNLHPVVSGRSRTPVVHTVERHDDRTFPSKADAARFLRNRTVAMATISTCCRCWGSEQSEFTDALYRTITGSALARIRPHEERALTGSSRSCSCRLALLCSQRTHAPRSSTAPWRTSDSGSA
jgi:hypothetical protein